MTCNCETSKLFKGNEALKKIESTLVHLASAYDDWDNLYQCRVCQTLWEKVYPNASYHGGGSPELRTITHRSAQKKYKVRTIN
jgi:hypothetical protein